jgi:hypothetical protein
MANYLFETISEIAAPVDKVWAEVGPFGRWETWWPGLVLVTQLEAGDEEGRGALNQLSFKSLLPYTLSFRARITKVDPLRRMEVEAEGELEGVAVYELEDLGHTTRMTLTWRVTTTKAWMNMVAPVARPFFEWNHDVLMKAGARGLARKLGTQLVRFESGHPLRGLLKYAPLLAGALWLRKRMKASRQPDRSVST